MSYSRNRRIGGLILDDTLAAPRFLRALRSGPDVSWLPQCRIGDDQGEEPACANFALANWAEIMHGYNISDEATLAVYRAALRDVGRSGGGLTYSKAFVAAHKSNWLPGARGIERVHDLSALKDQPILAAYRVTAAMDKLNDAGWLDHSADDVTRGYHAMVVAAHGSLLGIEGGPFVYVENQWRGWGWNGIGVMTEDLHRRLVRELWIIR